MLVDINQMSRIMGLMADPGRVRIINILASGKEFCVTEIARQSGAAMSAVSHQLRKLEFLGIVKKCRKGREICYCLNRKNAAALKILSVIKIFKRGVLS